MKKLETLELEYISGGDLWSRTWDCMQDQYRNYGWSSAALWVLTIIEPTGAFIVGSFCLGYEM